MISIVIPSYNHSRYLHDCVLSIISQSETNWEILIIDDGSTDSTAAEVAKYISMDGRINYHFQSNQGLSAARNLGLDLVKGEFVLFLDADDWIEPDCLKTLVKTETAFPDAELYQVGYAYWSKPNGRMFHHHLPTWKGLLYPQILTQNIGPCHSVMIRTNFARSLKGFDRTLKSCEDWDYWMQAGRMGARIYPIPRVLVAYRYVTDSMSRNPHTMYEALSEVSARSKKPDSRLPYGSAYNKSIQVDLIQVQKQNLLSVLGVTIHQGKIQQAAIWYKEEASRWNWSIKNNDWKHLSNYLSWRYFLDKEGIKQVMDQVYPNLMWFFVQLSYTPQQSKELARFVLAPQLKKRNHQKWGSLIGGVLNRLRIY